MDEFIPVNEPLLDGNEKKYLIECIDTGWISSGGPFVERFEHALAQRLGRQHGISVCNGSSAIEIAVHALGIGPGDEVILPAFTIIACAAPIIRAGATPVVVDCDPDTWNIRPEAVADRITNKTRAIMPVHIYGLPIEMDPILDIAERHGLDVIEDAAEVIGQTCRGRPCGGFGDLSTVSFYPNKHITTGEGGMVLTNDDQLAERCRSLRNLCFQEERRFLHEELGWTSRLSNVQAALGLAQLERLDSFIDKKREMGRRYAERLNGLPAVQLPLERTDYADNIYWVFGLVLDDSVDFDADEVIRRLHDKKIGARPFFWPIHEQPVFRKMGLFDGESCPVAERIARRGFYVPSGLALTGDQVDRVAESLWEILA